MIKYSTKLGDKICNAIAKSSIGLRLICQKLGLPYSTVTDWIYNPQHEMHSKYIQAKQLQLHCLAEEVLTMTDELTNNYMEATQNGKTKTTLSREQISLTRLRMQARINIITKLAPVLYKTAPQKIKHKVIMPEPPKALTPTPTLTPSAPAPKPAPTLSHPLETKDAPIAILTPDEEKYLMKNTDGSSPKTAPRRLPNGHLEWIGENGHLFETIPVAKGYCSNYRRW